jgi:hypothetical protein
MLKQIIKLTSAILILTATTQSTNSSFSDGLVLGDNIFSVGYWNVPPEAGEVIINEIMWMGSTADAADEWVELKNTTNRPIDISGCTLANAEAGNQMLTIEEGKTIKPNGYFLIVKKEPGNTALSDQLIIDQVSQGLSFHNDYNKNGQVTLTCDGTLIDQTPDPNGKHWPAGTDQSGSNKLRQSMERNTDPATGWHTCISKDCTSSAYWTQCRQLRHSGRSQFLRIGTGLHIHHN